MGRAAATPTRPVARKGFSDHDRIVLGEQDHDANDQRYDDLKRSQDNTNRLLGGILISVMLLLVGVIIDIVTRVNSGGGVPEALAGMIGL